MGLKKSLIVVFALLSASLTARAQRDSVSLQTIISKTQKFSEGYPFEKVYLHFDKPYYAVGDTIWFKAYLTIGPQHVPSGLSRIIYVDVISDRDSIIKSLKLPTVGGGVAFGNIALSPKVLKQGNYHVRAYTNWMRNFGPDYFFNKTLTIGDVYDKKEMTKVTFTKRQRGKEQQLNARILFKNADGEISAGRKVNWTVENDDETVSEGKGETDKNGYLTVSFDGNKVKSPELAKLVTEIETTSKSVLINTFPLKQELLKADVQFFPEGGELIDGVRSKVAFKAIDANGLGIDVTGSVVDNAGTEVATFTSQHLGMGIFALQPSADKTYKALVTFPDGAKESYDLPNVVTEGIGLAVINNNPDNLGIKIDANAAFFKEYKNKGFYIIAQSGGTIYYAGAVTLQNQVYLSSVPKSKFPTGVLQVTLFAADGEPFSERVAFVQRNDALGLNLTADQQSYHPRQDVKMTVTAKNKGVPVAGTFSVAVIDESKVPFSDDAETTILSSLLLQSDLRGYIEKPNYYFNQPDDKKMADLDVLMLTQGYRRFSYNNILAGKYPPVNFMPEKGMSVSGTLHTAAGLPVFKGVVTLDIPDRHITVKSVTDADGRFSFSNVSVLDSTKIFLNAKTYDRAVRLMILPDAQTYQPVTKNLPDPNAIINIDSTMNLYLQNSKMQLESQHTLNEVVIKSTKIERTTHDRYSALSGLSQQTDQSIQQDQLKYCSFDIISCIESKVFGLWHTSDNFFIKKDYDAGNKNPIQFFLNGMPIDYPYLTTIRTENVGLIEVYLTDGVSGINDRYRTNGIISITTKDGKMQPPPPKPDEQDLPTALEINGSTVTLMPMGYFKAIFFYSPKYTHQQDMSDMKADLRSTIYWNPNVTTDKNGNASFEFYNADGRGTYKAVIEGIDSDGNIGRYVMRYGVQ